MKSVLILFEVILKYPWKVDTKWLVQLALKVTWKITILRVAFLSVDFRFA